jgi:putative transposase
MNYTSGSHTVFQHRYHIVWITRYRYKVVEGVAGTDTNDYPAGLQRTGRPDRLRRFVAREHVHMFVEIPPHHPVSDFVRRVTGRSSHRLQREFPDMRKRTWGRHFWARGSFSTTCGNVTDDVILQYLREHEPPGGTR